MTYKQHEVTVILDRTFGDRLVPVALEGPVWIIDSAANRAAAEACREPHTGVDHPDGITLFNSLHAKSSEEALLFNMDVIDLHHGEYSADPPYSVLKVIGAKRTTQAEAALCEFGLIRFEDTPYGFRALRS